MPKDGEAVRLEAPELAGVLDDMVAAVRRHIVLPGEAADVVALWIAHTWSYERFDHTPRLAITSPVKQCGKSTLLEVVKGLCREAVETENATVAALFRKIHGSPFVTVLADEYDNWIWKDREMLTILNSGFKKGGTALRCEKNEEGEHVAVEFSTFAPVLLAGIKNLPSTLADRSIPIALQRRAQDEKIEKLRQHGNKAKLAELGRCIARLKIPTLDPDPVMPEGLSDRQADISVPLVAIADAAGAGWAERARNALVRLFGAPDMLGADADVGLRLLKHIREIMEPPGRPVLEKISSAALCARLASNEEAPRLPSGRPLEMADVAKVLKPYGIRPKLVRDGKESFRGYRREWFADAWQRYGIAVD